MLRNSPPVHPVTYAILLLLYCFVALAGYVVVSGNYTFELREIYSSEYPVKEYNEHKPILESDSEWNKYKCKWACEMVEED